MLSSKYNGTGAMAKEQVMTCQCPCIIDISKKKLVYKIHTKNNQELRDIHYLQIVLEF